MIGFYIVTLIEFIIIFRFILVLKCGCSIMCWKLQHFLQPIAPTVHQPQSLLPSWSVWHKQCHISDPCVLSRITRREGSNDVRGPVWGADRRIVSQPVPYPQTGRCPLSPRGRLLTRGEPGGCWNEETWELLRGWAGHLMSSTRAGSDAEWAEGERQPLQSVTKAQPGG